MGKTKATGILTLVVILQTIAIIWLIYDRLNQKEQNTVLVTQLKETTDEKGNVELELKKMLQEYESMKGQNADLNAKLSAEQEKIQKLIEELKYVQRTNRLRIKELETETETLRTIMKSFVKQIDSLNTRNNILREENKVVKGKYESEVIQKEEIKSQRDSLSGTVKKGQILKTYNISTNLMNQRDKETNRAKKFYKAEICFMLGENDITPKGEKFAFIRIADPSGQILMNKESGMFKYQDKDIAYSSKRKINYKGENTNVCVYWTTPEELPVGKYRVNIFVDGYDIGETSFELK